MRKKGTNSNLRYSATRRDLLEKIEQLRDPNRSVAAISFDGCGFLTSTMWRAIAPTNTRYINLFRQEEKSSECVFTTFLVDDLLGRYMSITYEDTN